MQAEIERLRKENESLKHCGADDEEKRLQLVTQISTIKEDIALSLRKTSATNKNLKKENEELVKQLNDLQSVRKENTEMRALKRENDRLNSLIEVDKGTLANLKSKVKKMTEERQSTEEYNDKLKKENTKLKLRIKSLEMEIESLKIRKKLPNADNDTRSVNSFRSNTSRRSNQSASLKPSKPFHLQKKTTSVTSSDRKKKYGNSPSQRNTLSASTKNKSRSPSLKSPSRSVGSSKTLKSV